MPISDELPFAQLAITTTALHQLIVGSSIDNSPLLKNHDAIGLLHRRQPVGDDQHRSSFHRLLQAELYRSLRFSIESTCGFIEQQKRWIAQHRPRNGDPLQLSTGDVGPRSSSWVS